MGKHDGTSPSSGVLGRVSPFVVRLAEQALMAFGTAFFVALPVEGGFTRPVLTAALVAGAQAAYGLIVKDMGELDRPTVK